MRNVATLGIQAEKVVEEKRDGKETICDELGVDLSCMSEAFGSGGGV